MEKIKLFKKRNFGDTIGTAFEFLRQNFKVLSMSFLVLVMPLLIISLITLALGFVGGVRQSIAHTSIGNQPGIVSIISILVGYFGYILAFYVEAIVVHMVVIAYEGSDDPATLTVSDIWTLIKKDMGRIVASFFGLFFFSLVFMIVVAIIYGIGAAISNSSAGLSMLIIYIASIYLQIAMSNYLMLILRSEFNIITAFGRSLRLTAGRWRWWKTLGITIVMTIVALSFYSVSLMPFSAAIYLYSTHVVSAMSRTEGLGVIYILMGLAIVYGGLILSYLINLVFLGHTINYYSLVEEEEHVGLRINIENLGIYDSSVKLQEGDY